MLITDDYRAQNTGMHKKRENYGKSSSQWIPAVFRLCLSMNTTDVLDYGCGKGDLHLGLPFGIQNYDPAIRKYSATPKPADIVVCTDVLEHVEPECLDDVLADLRRCVKNTGLFGIPQYKANRTLPDGRNAHLIVKDTAWWLDKLASAGFDVVDHEEMPVKGDKIYLAATVK